MWRLIKWVVGAGAIAAIGVLGVAIWQGQRPIPELLKMPAADAKRGAYLLHAGGCIACHTEPETLKAEGPILGGGHALKTPFGTFYGPNITKDPVHGIGKWSDAEFVQAFRAGRSPTGHNYFPAFPYVSFAALNPQDLIDIRAHIMELPAVAKPSKPHELGLIYRWRFGLTFWKWLFFSPGVYVADPAKSAEWNRGAYLVNHLGHCSECHTPRNLLGGFRRSLHLAGSADGPEGGIIPNITPDNDTGIGKWTEAQIVDLLKSGMTPDSDFVGGAMTEVVTFGTSKLSDADLKAMAVYLKSIKPIANKVEKKK